jgi:hypothetical protein
MKSALIGPGLRKLRAFGQKKTEYQLLNPGFQISRIGL